MSFIGQPAAGLSGLGSTDNAIVRTNGTAGTAAQGSLVTIDDSGNITAMRVVIDDGVGGGGLVVNGASGQSFINFIGGNYLRGTTFIQNGDLILGSNTHLLEAAANTLALRNGTADQTLSIGAATGTGGGVLVLNTLSAAPDPVAGQVQLYYLDGTGFVYLDRPLNANGSGLVLVPGAWTIGSGWTANADGGNKTAVIPSSATIATIQTAANLLAAGLGDLIAATAQKVKALEATAVNLVAPNN